MRDAPPPPLDRQGIGRFAPALELPWADVLDNDGEPTWLRNDEDFSVGVRLMGTRAVTVSGGRPVRCGTWRTLEVCPIRSVVRLRPFGLSPPERSARLRRSQRTLRSPGSRAGTEPIISRQTAIGGR